MGAEAVCGEAPASPSCALIQLLDWRGHALHAGLDHSLRFVEHGSSAIGCQWVLTAGSTAGTVALGHAASGKFLAAGSDLTLVDKPHTIQLFMDMEKRVALQLAGKACLQSSPGGAAVVGCLPLGKDRASKLFQLCEVGLPQHSLQAWPLRVVLRSNERGGGGGGFLSAGSGGALSTTAPAACCSEEFLLALGGAVPLELQGSTLIAKSSAVWTGDGRQLVSRDAASGQLLLQHQHSCKGRERFTLQLSAGGQLRLAAELPEASQQLADDRQQSQQRAVGPVQHSPVAGVASRGCCSKDGGAGAGTASSTALAPVVAREGGLVACGGGKASTLGLELASHKPVLLLTAHGHLLGCSKAQHRPSGGLLPPVGDGTVLSSGSTGVTAARSACLAASCWLLEHRGEGVYSLRQGASGRNLHVDGLGTPCLDSPGSPVTYPDERLLFWVEPAWVTLGGTPPACPLTPSSSSSSSYSSSSSTPPSLPLSNVPDTRADIHSSLSRRSSGDSCTSSGGGTAGASGAASSPPAGFLQAPGGGGGMTVAGFSVRSVARVGGRHLYLSALPDGLLTTVYALGRPSRWELFSVMDYQTLLHSPLHLLHSLPCAAATAPPPALSQAAPAAAVMRRATSMQALDSSSPASGPARGAQLAAEERQGGAVALQAAPALTPVPEHALSLERQLPLPPQQQVAARAAPPQGAQLADRLLQRRCRSETALSGLAARQRRPQWLAQLLVAPRQLEGWGLASAASLQQIAARQLCVTLVAQLQQQHGGRVLPLGVVEEVAAELAGRLPEEVAASITQHLRLLTQAPPRTKLSLHQLSIAAAAADSAAEAAAKQLVPIWAVPHLRAAGGGGGGGRPAALLLDWQPSEEAYLCCACRGASGPLLPLDPYLNPAHYLFLHAMERRARGGGRVRLRARRRLDREDPLLAALHTGRLALLAWGASKALSFVLFGSKAKD